MRTISISSKPLESSWCSISLKHSSACVGNRNDVVAKLVFFGKCFFFLTENIHFTMMPPTDVLGCFDAPCGNGIGKTSAIGYDRMIMIEAWVQEEPKYRDWFVKEYRQSIEEEEKRSYLNAGP